MSEFNDPIMSLLIMMMMMMMMIIIYFKCSQFHCCWMLCVQGGWGDMVHYICYEYRGGRWVSCLFCFVVFWVFLHM